MGSKKEAQFLDKSYSEKVMHGINDKMRSIFIHFFSFFFKVSATKGSTSGQKPIFLSPIHSTKSTKLGTVPSCTLGAVTALGGNTRRDSFDNSIDDQPKMANLAEGNEKGLELILKSLKKIQVRIRNID